MADLRALAEKFVSLSSEIESMHSEIVQRLTPEAASPTAASFTGLSHAFSPAERAAMPPQANLSRPARQAGQSASRRAEAPGGDGGQSRLIGRRARQRREASRSTSNCACGGSLKPEGYEGPRRPMAAGRGEGAPTARRSPPSVAVAELTAAAEAQPLDEPRPAAAYAPWIKPLSIYTRRETSELQAARYG